MPRPAGGLPGNGFAQVAVGLPAGVIAVRAADVACPGGTERAGALLAAPASAGPVTSGEMLVFTHPVTVAPAVVAGVVRCGLAAGCLIMCAWASWNGTWARG